MGTISLVLPGNTFHANQLSERMEKMDRERYGLPIFRKYRIPATVFFQGVDVLMKPWLIEETHAEGSIEWGHAMFSHTMLPLFPENWRQEIKLGTSGNVPVSFFGEFYAPKPELIPTGFTLVLAGNSVLYSACAEFWNPKQGDISPQQYPDSSAICFGGKIGILMREDWFGPFLRALFTFQRYPISGTHPEGRDCLALLIEEVRKIAELPDDHVVVCPLDLEAPWIGSNFGSAVWEIFFQELAQQGLSRVFTPLSSHLDYFSREATGTARPHRELNKWSNWEVQIAHMQRLRQVAGGNVCLKMIATGSDIFAAWGIKIMETRKRVSLDAVEITGATRMLPITYNQTVIEVQLAAYRAICDRIKFLEALEQVARVPQDDYFLCLAKEMARQTGW